MKNFTTKKLVIAALLLALGLVLPFLTAQIPEVGSALLPLHIPVLIGGFVCGAPLGAVLGLVLPILRSLLFTMPPLYPAAVAMAFEMAAYGFVCGLLYARLPRRTWSIYVSLLAAMLAGRVVWGVARLVMSGISGSGFTFAAFLSGAFTTAIPGIVLQIVLIPLLVMALQRAGFMKEEDAKRLAV